MGPFQLSYRACVGRTLDLDWPAEGVDATLQTVHVTLSVTKTYLMTSQLPVNAVIFSTYTCDETGEGFCNGPTSSVG